MLVGAAVDADRLQDRVAIALEPRGRKSEGLRACTERREDELEVVEQFLVDLGHQTTVAHDGRRPAGGEDVEQEGTIGKKVDGGHRVTALHSTHGMHVLQGGSATHGVVVFRVWSVVGWSVVVWSVVVWASGRSSMCLDQWSNMFGTVPSSIGRVPTHSKSPVRRFRLSTTFGSSCSSKCSNTCAFG